MEFKLISEVNQVSNALVRLQTIVDKAILDDCTHFGISVTEDQGVSIKFYEVSQEEVNKDI